MSVRQNALCAAVLLFAVACGGGGSGDSRGAAPQAPAPIAPAVATVATVEVALGSATLTVGASTDAAATLRDASGNALAGLAITWTSSNIAVAQVSATGVVSALTPGTTTISAASQGKSAGAQLTVIAVPTEPVAETPAPVASISVSLATSGLHAGETTQATALARDSGGNVLADRSVTWSTSNPAVAIVSGAGLVSAVGVGTATISATSEGRVGSASITVTLEPVATVAVTLAAQSLYVGQTTQATAVTRAAGGNVLTGRTITWISSNPAVAEVSSGGVVTAAGAGTTTILAFCESQFGSASITANPVPVASVSVTLASSIYIGQTAGATAVMRDAAGNVLYGRSVTWSTSNAAVASASGAGLVAAVGVGTATISATSEGRTGSATITVRDVPAAVRIAVDPPATATVRQALSRAPVVRLVNATGNDVANAGVTISVQLAGGSGALAGTTTRVTDATGAATFDDLSFTGRAVGTRTLVFTSPGLTGAASADIQVSAGAPASATAASALDQVADPWSVVASPPAVEVRDVDGNLVGGARVDFAVTLGGGSVSGSPATTGTDGIARLASWTLGAAGPQSVEATAAALAASPVSFLATARSAAAQYDITLAFTPGTNPTPAQRSAFLRAKARIEEVVTGDLPSMTFAAPTSCGGDVTFDPGEVDDLVIVVELAYIDGVGTILGRAGPCFVRGTGRQPYAGMMQFDTADLANMESNGQLDAVILHEMMHVLGVGTMWRDPAVNLLFGAGTSDPIFTGAYARAAFLEFNGGSFHSGTPVPVENLGATGTANSHWRESVFGRELMTGWITGASQPMSRTTVESLRDLGYAVQAASADPFDIHYPLLRADALEDEGVDLSHDALPITIHEVDEQGRATPLSR